jgi:hypothetical protein
MPEKTESLPPDTDPTTRGLLNYAGRCHAVQIVRHVPLPQLEALHEMHTDNGETQEGQIIGEKLSNHENDDKAIEANQGSDIPGQHFQ